MTSESWLIILGVLLTISESLAQIPQVKANSVFQVLLQILQLFKKPGLKCFVAFWNIAFLTIWLTNANALFGVGESGNVGVDWTNTTKNLNTTGSITGDDITATGVITPSSEGIYYNTNNTIEDKLEADISDWDSLAAAITAAGTTPTHLICKSASVVADGITVNVPITVTFEYQQGCMISGVVGGGTETLNFAKQPIGGTFQWIGSNLTVTGLSYAEPEWWGENTTPGTTDMTAEIQAADDALTAKGVLQFNAGVYLFSSSLSPAGSHTWQGLGSGVTELKSSYAGNNIVLISAVRIKGLTLNGVSKVAGSVGIYGAAKHNIELYQVEIKNFETGISVTGGIFWNVTLCNIHDNVDGLKAVTTGTGFNDNEFVSNKFVSNSGKGIWLQYSGSEVSSNTFIGTNVEDNGFGFYLLGVYNTTILGGFMEGQTVDHIYTDDSSGIFTTGLSLSGVRMNTMDPGKGVHLGGSTQDVSGYNLFLKDHDWINASAWAVHLYDCEEVGSGMVFGSKIIRRAATSIWADNTSIPDGLNTVQRHTYEDGEMQGRWAQETTTDAAETTLYSFALTDEKLYFIDAWIVAQKSDGSERSAYHIEGLFYRDGAGAATQEGTTTVISSIEGDAGMACIFDAGVAGSNNARVRVIGLAGVTFTWSLMDMKVRVL